jgi:hypothetical protein
VNEFKKRFYSLLWSGGMMALAVIIDGVIVMISDGTINIPQTYIVIAGLALAQISKAIKNSYSTK